MKPDILQIVEEGSLGQVRSEPGLERPIRAARRRWPTSGIAGAGDRLDGLRVTTVAFKICACADDIHMPHVGREPNQSSIEVRI